MTGQLEAGGARRFIHRWQSTGHSKRPGPVPDSPPIPWETGYTGHLGTWAELRAALNTKGHTDDILYAYGADIGGQFHFVPMDMCSAGSESFFTDNDYGPSIPLTELVSEYDFQYVDSDGDTLTARGSVYKIEDSSLAVPAIHRDYERWGGTSLGIAAGTGKCEEIKNYKITYEYNVTEFDTETSYIDPRPYPAPMLLPVYDTYIIMGDPYTFIDFTSAEVWAAFSSLWGKYTTQIWLPDGITGDTDPARTRDEVYIFTKLSGRRYYSIPPQDITRDTNGNICIRPVSAGNSQWEVGNPVKNYTTLGIDGPGLVLPNTVETKHTNPPYAGTPFYMPGMPMFGGAIKTSRPYPYLDNKPRPVGVCYVVKQLWPTKLTPIGKAFL